MRRIVIGGTGRAGTTLLVRILTEAGLDTGFSRNDFDAVESNVGRAGLELNIRKGNANRLPLVVKSPHLVDVIDQLLEEQWFEIGLAILPMRDLDSASESRVAVQERGKEAGLKSPPGGLWKTKDPRQQRWILAAQFFRTLEPLVTHEVPVRLVSFPRYAKDFEYFMRAIGQDICEMYQVDVDRMRDAYDSQCRPELITQK